MRENSFVSQRQQAPSTFNLFTGGKTSELAIFFNTALSNLENLIKHLTKKDSVTISSLSDGDYINLRNYLWKGYWQNKNKAGYSLIDEDKQLIIELYNKLSKLRHFHSHIWHDHEVNHFSPQLYDFLSECLQVACAATKATYPQEIDFFHEQLKEFPHFKKHNNKQYVTKEGKVFFLSLFLTKGEMSALLQQLKGSKRTDMPHFKIKHIVYRFFCHRDGSTLLQHHQDETFFQDLTEEQQRNILRARQAYKIISYLNDVPNQMYDEELVPLLISAGGEKLEKAETVHHLNAFIKQHQFFPEWILKELYLSAEQGDDKEKAQRDGVIELQLKGNEDYYFYISRKILYRLIIDRIIKSPVFEQEVKEKLLEFIQRREKLFEFLTTRYEKQQVAVLPEEITKEWLVEYRPQANVKLNNLYEKWLDSYEKERNSERSLGINLANKIRPLEHPGFSNKKNDRRGKYTNRPMPIPQPIVLHLYDFFTGASQKPRSSNSFVNFAVRYLIDQKITPSWYWQMETFSIQEKDGKSVLRKKKVFSKNDIPDDHHLTIINDHVLVGIPRTEIKDTYSDQRQNFYQFLLGPKVLRYLLCHHILMDSNPSASSGKPLETFLTGGIASDYQKLLSGIKSSCEFEQINFSLFEPQHLPDFIHKKLRRQKVTDQFTKEHRLALDKKLINRINSITQELNNIALYHYKLTRSNKNRVIMRCYTLFNWAPKFLRKSEYNEMSICHYVIGERDKFNYLFRKTFQLVKRVPKEVLGLVQQSSSLDELLQHTIKEAITILSHVKEQTYAGRLEEEALKLWARKIGLGVPEELMTTKEQEEIELNRNNNLLLLPFDIHPSLVLKYFYRERYDNKEFTKGSILSKIREQQYINGLRLEHYPEQQLQDFYLQFHQQPSEEKRIGRIISKITGSVQTTLSEDAILWQIAKSYMRSNSITDTIMEAIEQSLTEGGHLRVGNLHNAMINIKVGVPVYVKGNSQQYSNLGYRDKMRLLAAALHIMQSGGRRNTKTNQFIINDLLDVVRDKFGIDVNDLKNQLQGTDDIVVDPLYTKLRLHQFDDYLFRVNRNRLSYAAMHYINRVEYETADETIAFNGSFENPIPFEVLVREIQLSNRLGQLLCDKLLLWERNIIEDFCITTGASDDPDIMQQILVNWVQGANSSIKSSSYYLSFPNVCKMSGTQLAKSNLDEGYFKQVRNGVLHSKIPVTGSYNQMADPQTALGQLLKIEVPLASVRDRSMYLKHLD